LHDLTNVKYQHHIVKFPLLKFHENMFRGSPAFFQTGENTKRRQEDVMKIMGTFLQTIVANGPETDKR
jgi:hypothetical protein